MCGVTGKAPRKRRVVLAVKSVEEALGALAAREADVIAFDEIPSDLLRLSSLPPGLRVDLPYREDCLGACRAPGLRVRVRLACRKFPSVEEACAALLLVSKAGLPCLVEDVDALTPAEARRVVDLFLHDPGVSRPIDPLATILVALIQKKRVSLWDLLGPGADPQSEEFLLALPREHPECLECRYFPLCEGYGAWARTCETWREVLAGLAAAARRLSRLRENPGQPPVSPQVIAAPRLPEKPGTAPFSIAAPDSTDAPEARPRDTPVSEKPGSAPHFAATPDPSDAPESACRRAEATAELPRDHDAADSPGGDLDR